MRIKELREKAGLSQLQLSRKIKVAQNTLSNWENQKRKPSYDILIYLSNLFHVSVDYLIENDKDIDSVNNIPINLLRCLREENSYTKKFIGDYLKISPEGYSHYEKGIRQPSIYVLKKLSVLYGVSIDFLVGNNVIYDMNIFKKMRIEKGLKQIDVATSLGISRQRYGNYENGIRQPDNDILIQLSKFYNVTVDYLIGNNNVQQHNEKQEDETNTIFIMSRNGKNRKIKLSEEEAEKLEKLLELTMPSVLDGDDF